MGKLAEDMNRLSDEIIRFRGARKTFVDDVKHRVSEMMADFANTRPERQAFVHDLTRISHTPHENQATFCYNVLI